jgi:hypothetical protein
MLYVLVHVHTNPHLVAQTCSCWEWYVCPAGIQNGRYWQVVATPAALVLVI